MASFVVIEDDLFNPINANVFSNYIYISYLDPMGTCLLPCVFVPACDDTGFVPKVDM